MSNTRKINQFDKGFAGCLSLAFLSSFTIRAENDETPEEVLGTKGSNRLQMWMKLYNRLWYAARHVCWCVKWYASARHRQIPVTGVG